MERGEIRMIDPDYIGNASTNLDYIVESILLPEVYIVHVEGATEEMSPSIGKLLTEQDLADIIAWLNTFE